MTHHFDQIHKTQLFNEMNGIDCRAYCTGEKDCIDCFHEDSNRIFIMEVIVHCSDISNPFKKFEICSTWAHLVIEEFCLQGLDISPMMDRESINLCNMQMGFIEFVVAPLVNC
eukprot:gene23864-30967_t